RINSDSYFGLVNRSRHTLNAKAFYEIPKWGANANVRLIYRSRFGLSDRNGNGFLDDFDDTFIDGYALVNLSFGKTFFKHYQLQVGANNLLDFRGESPLSTSEIQIQVNPGIQVFGRINIQF
ncbi:MAG: TonB-dependent receptor, partial [Bacteroidota bacterium]